MSAIRSLTFIGGIMPGQLSIEGITGSRYSHVWADVVGGSIIDATMQHKGVKERERPKRGPTSYLWEKTVIIHAPQPQREFLYRILKSQEGKPYDWPWVFGYPINRDWQQEDAWACAELLAWGKVHAGLLRPVKQHRITPGKLLEMVV